MELSEVGVRIINDLLLLWIPTALENISYKSPFKVDFHGHCYTIILFIFYTYSLLRLLVAIIPVTFLKDLGMFNWDPGYKNKPYCVPEFPVHWAYEEIQ